MGLAVSETEAEKFLRAQHSAASFGDIENDEGSVSDYGTEGDAYGVLLDKGPKVKPLHPWDKLVITLCMRVQGSKRTVATLVEEIKALELVR